MTGRPPRAIERGAFPVGAVLLAAGRGTRFGPGPKLLAQLDGKALVRHAAEAAALSAAYPLVVVLGAHADGVRRELAGLDIRFVENPDHAAGLSTSLRTGLAALPADAQGAIVLLGDMPRVTALLLDALIDAYLRGDPRPCAVIPVFRGQRGNPVLIDHRSLAAELAGLSGDRGAGPMLAKRADVLEIAAGSAILFDVDTPDALAAPVAS